MEPLAHMPDDVARTLEGVAFDVDDTLTRHGVVEREAFDALWALRDAGVALLALTGRPLGFAEVWARSWPVHGVVGENGAGWVGRRGADVVRGFMLDDAEREARMRGLERILERVRRELPEVEVSNDHWARRCDLAFDVGEARQVDAATRARLIDLIRDEGAHPTVSTVHAHAAPGTWDKATGAQRAARDLLDVDLNEARPRWLFVGDSGNDAAAFAWFAHTVGVANVRDHLDALPVAPRWITRADRGRGFAEVAARVLHGR